MLSRVYHFFFEDEPKEEHHRGVKAYQDLHQIPSPVSHLPPRGDSTEILAEIKRRSRDRQEKVIAANPPRTHRGSTSTFSRTTSTQTPIVHQDDDFLNTALTIGLISSLQQQQAQTVFVPAPVEDQARYTPVYSSTPVEEEQTRCTSYSTPDPEPSSYSSDSSCSSSSDE
jgi:hypothetical protein